MTDVSDEFHYYTTDDEQMRNVFRSIDPVFGFSRFDGVEWVDAWKTYRRVLNGDMDPITPAQASSIVARLTREPNRFGDPVRLTEEESAQRVAIVRQIQANVAAIPVPPGAERITLDALKGRYDGP